MLFIKMGIKEVHKWEQTVVDILNIDGWNLTWCGEDYEYFDAKGLTPKKNECVIEMKFRHKYYETKLLEKGKYERLLQLPQKIHKLYLVFDPKGMYIFWLNKLDLPELEKLNCPDTTLWTKKKKEKEVYLLEESQASYINNESGFDRCL
jgi:hypothetical protein|tara:strand:+ start:3342 stop:3788 length:447 start_codon:yes stop_codon:yes gene_type:complete